MITSTAQRRRLGLATLALAACAMTSCAAGQDAQTAEEVPAIDGAYGAVGHLQLDAVAILAPQDGSTSYAAGGSAGLTLAITNTGTSPDTLTSVSSTVASGWSADPASGSATSTAVSSASMPATSSSTGSATDAGSQTSSSSGLPVGDQSGVDLSISAGDQLSFALPSSTAALYLTGLSRQLYTAATVPVTFTFQNAGAVTIDVPVQISGEPGSSTVPAPSGESNG